MSDTPRCNELINKHGFSTTRNGDKAVLVSDYRFSEDAFALARQLERELVEARAEIEEHHELVRMCHKRTVDADKIWQKAHNKPDVWPDLGELIQWLLSLIKTPKNCAEELGCERKLYVGCSDCPVFAPREIKK